MAKNGPPTMEICKRFSWRGDGKLVLKKDPFHISIFKMQYFLMFIRMSEFHDLV